MQTRPRTKDFRSFGIAVWAQQLPACQAKRDEAIIKCGAEILQIR